MAASCLDQAHAATGHNRKPGMPAVMRDFDTQARRSLNSIEALVADLELLSVDDDDSHV
jgi:hypothetical protein